MALRPPSVRSTNTSKQLLHQTCGSYPASHVRWQISGCFISRWIFACVTHKLALNWSPFFFDTCCAKKKALSLSKLEFQDFSLAPWFKNENLKAFTVKKNNIFMWTISTTVTQWPNFKDKWPVFVGKRVGELLESTTLDEWHVSWLAII